MPGILHETAVEKARVLLGAGASTKGMRDQIRRWLNRADFLDTSDIRQVDCTDDATCSDLDDGLLCRKCITRNNRAEVREWPSVIPDAFRIHRDDPCCAKDERFFLIDAIEIDGGHVLRQKIDRWMGFGEAVDFNDYAFLRLRIFSEHFVQIGEYTEADLFRMSIADVCKKHKPVANPDPNWAAMALAIRDTLNQQSASEEN